MLSKTMSRSTVSVLGIILAVTLFVGFSGNMAIAVVPDTCGNNEEFTTDFLIDECKFKTKGRNPYFILLPGWRFVLENEEADEREIVTVLHEKKRITLDGRKIYTRVVEERALERDGEDWVTVEISRNWIAICDKTNDVYYFGEDSKDCEDGFDPEDESKCEDGSEPETGGSWEAGKPLEVGSPKAQPGILMPGTFLLGAKYFQEVAVNLAEPEESAIDRGEHVAMGEEVEVPAGEWEDCIVVIDTNPADAECCEELNDSSLRDWAEECDVKTYCPGIGIVMDQDLELVRSGFVNKKGEPIKKKLK